MPNIITLGFVDTFALVASLPVRIGLFGKGDGLRTVIVRGPKPGTELEDENFAFFKRAYWPEMKIMLDRLKRLGGPDGIELGLVSLEMLDPGVALPWDRESGAYAERYTRAHLALRTNPGALFYCGPEMIHMQPGWVNAINRLAPCSQTNFGEHPRIHLVVDFRRKDQE